MVMVMVMMMLMTILMVMVMVMTTKMMTVRLRTEGDRGVHSHLLAARLLRSRLGRISAVHREERGPHGAAAPHIAQ